MFKPLLAVEPVNVCAAEGHSSGHTETGCPTETGEEGQAREERTREKNEERRIL